MKKIVSLIILASFVSAASCAQLKAAGTTATATAANCAKVDLGVTVTGLNLQTIEGVGESVGMAVLAIIAAGGSSWQADLAALGAKYGADALQCALQVAEAVFRQAPSATPSTKDAAETAHDRAVIALGQK